MFNMLLADVSGIARLDLWYALPMIAAVSLVYAATRHEDMRSIWAHAGRVALWIAGFMFVVFLLLELLDWLSGR